MAKVEYKLQDLQMSFEAVDEVIEEIYGEGAEWRKDGTYKDVRYCTTSCGRMFKYTYSGSTLHFEFNDKLCRQEYCNIFMSLRRRQ